MDDVSSYLDEVKTSRWKRFKHYIPFHQDSAFVQAEFKLYDIYKRGDGETLVLPLSCVAPGDDGGAVLVGQKRDANRWRWLRHGRIGIAHRRCVAMRGRVARLHG